MSRPGQALIAAVEAQDVWAHSWQAPPGGGAGRPAGHRSGWAGQNNVIRTGRTHTSWVRCVDLRRPGAGLEEHADGDDAGYAA